MKHVYYVYLFMSITSFASGMDSSMLSLLEQELGRSIQKDDQLFEAAKAGNLEQVKLLLLQDANINGERQENYSFIINTPLIEAIKNRTITTAHALIQAGANIHAQQEGALRYAAAKGFKSLVELLISLGADVNAESHIEGEEGYNTALLAASSGGYADIVEILLRAGGFKNQFYTEALLMAVTNWHLAVMRVFHLHITRALYTSLPGTIFNTDPLLRFLAKKD
jgi:ankyrin repeat protein